MRSPHKAASEQPPLATTGESLRAAMKTQHSQKEKKSFLKRKKLLKKAWDGTIVSQVGKSLQPPDNLKLNTWNEFKARFIFMLNLGINCVYLGLKLSVTFKNLAFWSLTNPS